VTTSAQAGGGAARPQLLRALNEQLLLKRIRQAGRCSRADLARFSGLSKPTVSLALANLEQAGLVHEAGQQTGAPGRRTSGPVTTGTRHPTPPPPARTT
jgi:DNA-binding transcriptional ArsR family regulator